jgi:hypothetical protein
MGGVPVGGIVFGIERQFCLRSRLVKTLLLGIGDGHDAKPAPAA